MSLVPSKADECQHFFYFLTIVSIALILASSGAVPHILPGSRSGALRLCSDQRKLAALWLHHSLTAIVARPAVLEPQALIE